MEIAPPRPRFTRQHQKEKSSLLFGFARDRFFLKWKGHFSFWCSALQVFGQCGGAKCGADEAKQNYFCGRKRICFASALFSKRRDLVSAAQEGAGGMRGGFLFGFFGGGLSQTDFPMNIFSKTSLSKMRSAVFFITTLPLSKT